LPGRLLSSILPLCFSIIRFIIRFLHLRVVKNGSNIFDGIYSYAIPLPLSAISTLICSVFCLISMVNAIVHRFSGILGSPSNAHLFFYYKFESEFENLRIFRRNICRSQTLIVIHKSKIVKSRVDRVNRNPPFLAVRWVSLSLYPPYEKTIQINYLNTYV
jgi:hypothetical protein